MTLGNCTIALLAIGVIFYTYGINVQGSKARAWFFSVGGFTLLLCGLFEGIKWLILEVSKNHLIHTISS